MAVSPAPLALLVISVLLRLSTPPIALQAHIAALMAVSPRAAAPRVLLVISALLRQSTLPIALLVLTGALMVVSPRAAAPRVLLVISALLHLSTLPIVLLVHTGALMVGSPRAAAQRALQETIALLLQLIQSIAALERITLQQAKKARLHVIHAQLAITAHWPLPLLLHVWPAHTIHYPESRISLTVLSVIRVSTLSQLVALLTAPSVLQIDSVSIQPRSRCVPPIPLLCRVAPHSLTAVVWRASSAPTRSRLRPLLRSTRVSRALPATWAVSRLPLRPRWQPLPGSTRLRSSSRMLLPRPADVGCSRRWKAHISLTCAWW